MRAGLQRTLDSGNAGLGQRFSSLKTIETTGDDTVTLKFPDGTAASWYDLLGTWETTIVKPGTNFDGIPVGAGPMKVTGYKAGQTLTMAEYEDYWMADDVKLAGMEFVHIDISQPQTATAALKSGLVDVANSDPTQLAALTGNYEPFKSENEAAVVRMDFCRKDGPLANPLVRKAINNAIDRESVSAGAYGGAATPADQMFPNDHRFWNDSVGDDLGYDLNAAKAALAQAGYPNGFSFDLFVPPGFGLPEVGQIVEQQLAAIGIDTNLKVTANFVEEFAAANIAGASLAPGSVSGRTKLASFTGDGLANICDYDDPELTALIDQLQDINDNSDEAKVLWDKITGLIYTDALDSWLVFRSQLAGYNTTRVAGLEMWPKGLTRVPLVYGTYVRAKD